MLSMGLDRGGGIVCHHILTVLLLVSTFVVDNVTADFGENESLEEKIGNGVLFAIGVFAVLIFIAVIFYILRCSGCCQNLYSKLTTTETVSDTLPYLSASDSPSTQQLESSLEGGGEVYSLAVDDNPVYGEWRRVRRASLPSPMYANLLIARENRALLNIRCTDSNSLVAPSSECLRSISPCLPPAYDSIRSESPPPDYDKLESNDCEDMGDTDPPPYIINPSLSVDGRASSLMPAAA